VQAARPRRQQSLAGAPGAGFYVTVMVFVLGLLLAGTRPISNSSLADGFAVFVLVTAGWVLSLIFHEFSHAYLAWRGGDRSIPAKGYLSLDPRTYADPILSIAFPLLVLVLGGIGLPGGAVWINRRAIPSRFVNSLVSIAGPLTNLALATVCLMPLSSGVVSTVEHPVLAAGLGFLGTLQVIAFVINILPIPGLDGYSTLEPFLPRQVRQALVPAQRWGFFVLAGLYFYVPAFNDILWDTVISLTSTFGVERSDVSEGYQLFRFWST